MPANELLHRVPGAVKGLSGTKHVALSLSEGSEEDLPGLHRVNAVKFLVGELNHDPPS